MGRRTCVNGVEFWTMAAAFTYAINELDVNAEAGIQATTDEGSLERAHANLVSILGVDRTECFEAAAIGLLGERPMNRFCERAGIVMSGRRCALLRLTSLL
jgi:hypothetical protein